MTEVPRPTAPAGRSIASMPVSAVALGCAALALEHEADPGRGRAVINAALDAGITLLDTAAAYSGSDGTRINENMIREVLAARCHDEPGVRVATKGGHYRQGDSFPVDARPATLRRHCEQSLVALGVERIDLYFLHWPDPAVPVEESVGALAQLKVEGKIGQIGVSNVQLEQLVAAQRTAHIAAVQNRFSLFDQAGRDVLEYCDRSGTSFLAYSPLRGLAHASPELEQRLARIAAVHSVRPARVALAWLLSRSPVVVPVVGASRPETAADAAQACSLTLSDLELEQLNEVRA